MSRETEFLGLHKDDLRQGSELCRVLHRNVIEIAPREVTYLKLMAICKRLEGTCRQFGHERGDDARWFDLGHHYYRVGEMVRTLRRGHKWMQFGELAKVFEAGIGRVQLLATAATGMTSLHSNTLLLPQFLRPKAGSIIIP